MLLQKSNWQSCHIDILFSVRIHITLLWKGCFEEEKITKIAVRQTCGYPRASLELFWWSSLHTPRTLRLASTWQKRTTAVLHRFDKWIYYVLLVFNKLLAIRFLRVLWFRIDGGKCAGWGVLLNKWADKCRAIREGNAKATSAVRKPQIMWFSRTLLSWRGWPCPSKRSFPSACSLLARNESIWPILFSSDSWHLSVINLGYQISPSIHFEHILWISLPFFPQSKQTNEASSDPFFINNLQ